MNRREFIASAVAVCVYGGSIKKNDDLVIRYGIECDLNKTYITIFDENGNITSHDEFRTWWDKAAEHNTKQLEKMQRGIT